MKRIIIKPYFFYFLAAFFLACYVISLPVSGNDCMAKYSRSDYPHWGPSEEFADIRQQVIAGAVVSGLVVEGGRVTAGLWYDPFTGQNYRLKDVKPDVDHLASLGWVHERGGACASGAQRRAIANDPLNLWAVHPSANRRKGKNVTGFLPANIGICTEYLSSLKVVINKYEWIKLKPGDVETYNHLALKCQEWKNGIKIQKARKWYQVFNAK